MYALEQLQQKSLNELKEIGWELNVLPKGHRGRRKSWIDAIADVNPPLLQLLEVSPAVSVEQVQEPIIETVESSPAVSVEQAQEPPIESKFGRIVYPRPAQGAIAQAAENTPGVEVDPIQGAIETQSKSDCPTCKAADSLHLAYDCCLEMWFVQCLHCDYHRPMNRSSNYLAVPDPALNLFGILPYKHQLLKRLELQATEANEFPAPAHARFQVGDLVKSVGQRWGISPDLTGEVVALNPSGGLFVYFGPAGGHRDYSRFESKDLIKLGPIEEVQALEPIVPVAENSIGVESVELTQKAQKYKFLLCLEYGGNTLWYDGKDFVVEKWSAKTYCNRGVGAAKYQLCSHPVVKRAGNGLQVVENSPRIEVKPIEVQAQEVIAQVPKTSPCVDLYDELPECSNCFGDGYMEDEFGVVKFCQCNEPKLSHQKTQSAIVPAVEKLPRSESDPNPILTGIPLSDRFVARYSPPQPENIHFKADTDGQLSLLDFEVELVNEPPDPDDFASIEEFQEALARWDAENAEMLAVSMDSMCEWAPCPDEWYEPEPESLPLKASSRMELSPPAIECSITSTNFTIPTFDAWCDRANRQTDTDEPPDTGIFARLPGPKPPRFPPQVGHKSDTSRTQGCKSARHPETIPKLFSVAAGTSTQPARSPPGGDANFA